MSNGDTPSRLVDFIGSQGRGLSMSERSIENIRGEEMDEVEVLRKEIEELSNEQTSVDQMKVK